MWCAHVLREIKRPFACAQTLRGRATLRPPPAQCSDLSGVGSDDLDKTLRTADRKFWSASFAGCSLPFALVVKT